VIPGYNDEARQGGSDKRIGLLRILLLAVVLIYSLHLFNMQILSGDQYRSHAQDISRRTVVLPSQRGEIFDRSYTQPLALNADSFAVSIVPAEVPRGRVSELIADVAAILGIPANEIEAKIPARLSSVPAGRNCG